MKYDLGKLFVTLYASCVNMNHMISSKKVINGLSYIFESITNSTKTQSNSDDFSNNINFLYSWNICIYFPHVALSIDI